jgi:flagellar motor switch protein FliN/FliY
MTMIASDIELSALSERPEGAPLLIARKPILSAVHAKVDVRVGTSEMSLQDLLNMKEGAVISLDRLVDEPVDIMIAGQVIARGMLVAVDEYFGVRVTESAELDSPSVES